MFTLAPVLPIPLLIAGGLVLLALLGWLAWRGAAVAWGRRVMLLGLRVLAVAVILALLLNPGRWQTEGETEPPGWALLLDQSASMAVADAGANGATARSAAARQVAANLLGESRDARRVTARTFAGELGPAWQPEVEVAADGGASRLGLAGRGFLEQAAGEATPWTGLVVLSDGRQTAPAEEIAVFAQRAVALGIPVHAVVFGGEVVRGDLALRLPRRQIVAFPNQPATLPVQVENRGLGPVQPEVRLFAGESTVPMATLSLAVQPGQTAAGEFTLPPGSPAGDYRVELPLLPGDEIPENNEGYCHLRLLENRTRVFLAEGAPYWDTKFLAQLLRDQGMMEVDAVFRLQADRFYRVTTRADQRAALEEAQSSFPDSAAEVNRYDLVVLGKGADAFLTPSRLDLLRSFVRDQGGALLFSRGKPYPGSFEGLESLEPGRWGEITGSEHLLLPTPEGEESGLFGERLPGLNAAVWRTLSPLSDSRSLAELRPFTRVLAVGERVGGGAKIPLLVARRHGRGLVAALNGDGLWRWGFNARREAERDDWHREFWLQLLQWSATYSEFLPGEDFSLRLSAGSVALGGSVSVGIGYRGPAPAPAPVIELITADGGSERIPAAEAGTGEDGHSRWGVLLLPKVAGAATIRLLAEGQPGPAVTLQVLAPPSENDELSADPGTLRDLTAATGGRVWQAAEWRELLDVLEPHAARIALDEARWEPLWPQSWLLLFTVGLLTAEWFGRRRLGLL